MVGETQQSPPLHFNLANETIRNGTMAEHCSRRVCLKQKRLHQDDDRHRGQSVDKRRNSLLRCMRPAHVTFEMERAPGNGELRLFQSFINKDQPTRHNQSTLLQGRIVAEAKITDGNEQQLAKQKRGNQYHYTRCTQR